MNSSFDAKSSPSPHPAVRTAQVDTYVFAMLSGLRLTSALLGVLALGLCSEALVVRKPSPVTLPFARRFNATGASKILEHDQARARALKARALAKPGQLSRRIISNDPVTNQAVDYVATERSLLAYTLASVSIVADGVSILRLASEALHLTVRPDFDQRLSFANVAV